jgi:transcriptional regulator with XRE-family HTH domain
MPPRERKNRFAQEFGLVVRRLREARNWSYTDLARRTRLTPTYVRLLEGGSNVTSILTLQWLAHAFGMRSWDLLRQVEEMIEAANKDAQAAATEQRSAQERSASEQKSESSTDRVVGERADS